MSINLGELRKACDKAKTFFEDEDEILKGAATTAKDFLLNNEQSYHDSGDLKPRTPWFQLDYDFKSGKVPQDIALLRAFSIWERAATNGLHRYFNELGSLFEKLDEQYKEVHTARAAIISTGRSIRLLRWLLALHKKEKSSSEVIHRHELTHEFKTYAASMTNVSEWLDYRGSSDAPRKKVYELTILGLIDATNNTVPDEPSWIIKLGKAGIIFFDECLDPVVKDMCDKYCFLSQTNLSK